MDEHRRRVNVLPTSAEYDHEVSLAEYLAVLWRYRLALLGVVVAAGAAALLVDWNRPRVYQANSRLMVSASKIGDAIPPVSMGNYQAIVGSQSLASETLDELGLSKPPHNISAAEVMNVHLSVRAVPDTNVIQITTWFSDPAVAAEFANRLADKAVVLARDASRDDTITARDTIKIQVDELRGRLDDIERTLETYKKQANVDALRADVGALMYERGRLPSLAVAIEAERGRVRQITEELTKHEPVRNVRGATVPRTPAAEPKAPSSGPPAIRQDLLDPYVNPVYEGLQQELAQSRAKLSALEKERAAVAQTTSGSAAASHKIQELYSSEAEIERLEMERDMARRAYIDTSTRYEQARLQVASRSANVQVIDKAAPSTSPVSPRIARDVAAAIAMSLIIASAAILLLTALRSNGFALPNR